MTPSPSSTSVPSTWRTQSACTCAFPKKGSSSFKSVSLLYLYASFQGRGRVTLRLSQSYYSQMTEDDCCSVLKKAPGSLTWHWIWVHFFFCAWLIFLWVDVLVKLSWVSPPRPLHAQRNQTRRWSTTAPPGQSSAQTRPNTPSTRAWAPSTRLSPRCLWWRAYRYTKETI